MKKASKINEFLDFMPQYALGSSFDEFCSSIARVEKRAGNGGYEEKVHQMSELAELEQGMRIVIRECEEKVSRMETLLKEKDSLIEELQNEVLRLKDEKIKWRTKEETFGANEDPLDDKDGCDGRYKCNNKEYDFNGTHQFLQNDLKRYSHRSPPTGDYIEEEVQMISFGTPVSVKTSYTDSINQRYNEEIDRDQYNHEELASLAKTQQNYSNSAFSFAFNILDEIFLPNKNDSKVDIMMKKKRKRLEEKELADSKYFPKLISLLTYVSGQFIQNLDGYLKLVGDKTYGEFLKEELTEIENLWEETFLTHLEKIHFIENEILSCRNVKKLLSIVRAEIDSLTTRKIDNRRLFSLLRKRENVKSQISTIACKFPSLKVLASFLESSAELYSLLGTTNQLITLTVEKEKLNNLRFRGVELGSLISLDKWELTYLKLTTAK